MRMNDNDIKFQTMNTISISGLVALLESVVLVSTRTVKQGELDPCHKAATTIAVLVKAIKDAESHNKDVCPDTDNDVLNPIVREPLSSEELRTRLTRYLKRLDDDVVMQGKGNVYESD